MIYNGIDIHGASYLEPTADGVCPRRYPAEVRAALNESGQNAALNLCGMELRFVPQGEVKITMSTVGEKSINAAWLFYGSTQAGWETGAVRITHTPQAFTFRPSARPAFLGQVAQHCNHPFAPTVLRLVLDSAQIVIHSIEGDVRPPKAEEVPRENILFYGSSITHGSLAAAPVSYWCRRVAENFRRDHINLGLAGSCLMQAEVADWIAARTDWQVAVLEMGINVLDKYDEDTYRERVRYMIETVHAAHPDKYIFCIDVFYYYGDMFGNKRVGAFREIMAQEVARIASDRVVHIPALSIMGGMHGLSEDMVHPSAAGVEEMARNLSEALKPYLQ